MSQINSARKRRLYQKLLARDGNKCYICGVVLNDSMTIDHIIGRGEGGSNSQDNLRLSCYNCNNKKSYIESYLSRSTEVHLTDNVIKKICEAYSYYRDVLRRQRG